MSKTIQNVVFASVIIILIGVLALSLYDLIRQI